MQLYQPVNSFKPNLKKIKVKSNSSLSGAWPSSAPVCFLVSFQIVVFLFMFVLLLFTCCCSFCFLLCLLTCSVGLLCFHLLLLLLSFTAILCCCVPLLLLLFAAILCCFVQVWCCVVFFVFCCFVVVASSSTFLLFLYCIFTNILVISCWFSLCLLFLLPCCSLLFPVPTWPVVVVRWYPFLFFASVNWVLLVCYCTCCSFVAVLVEVVVVPLLSLLYFAICCFAKLSSNFNSTTTSTWVEMATFSTSPATQPEKYGMTSASTANFDNNFNFNF